MSDIATDSLPNVHTARELAVLSKAAYAAGDVSEINQVIDSNGFDHNAYEILSSTNEDALVVRAKNGDGISSTDDIVIAIRGTDISNDSGNRGRDIGEWPSIAFGNTRSSRTNEIRGIVEQVRKKYPNNKIIFTGHSLGGWVASTLARETGYRAVVFNPGAGIDTPFRNYDNNVDVYRTPMDVVSITDTMSQTNIHIIPVKPGNGSHDLDNFLDTDNVDLQKPYSADTKTFSTNKTFTKKSNEFDARYIAAGIRGFSGSYVDFNRMTPMTTKVPLGIQVRSLLLDTIYKDDPVMFLKGLKKLYGVDAMKDLPFNSEDLPFSKKQIFEWVNGDQEGPFSHVGLDLDELEGKVLKTQHLLWDSEEGILTIPLLGNINAADNQLVHLILKGEAEKAAAFFRSTEQFQYLNHAMESLENIKKVDIVGHSAGGYKTRLLIQDLAEEWPQVNFEGNILNGHVIESVVKSGPFTTLPDNVTLSYHDIQGDISSFKNRFFEGAEMKNGAKFSLYTENKIKFTKDFLADYKQSNFKGTFKEFSKRFHKTATHKHDIDHFNDLEIAKDGDSFIPVDGPKGEAYDRTTLPKQQNRGREFLDAWSVIEGIGAGIAGEGIASALDPHLDKGVAGDIEHIGISGTSGAIVYGGVQTLKTAGKVGINSGFEAVTSSGTLLGEEFLLGAAEFGPAALAGMLTQYGASYLTDLVLKKSHMNESTKKSISSITGGAAGGMVAGAVGALATANPVGAAVATGLLMGALLSSAGAAVEAMLKSAKEGKNGGWKDAMQTQQYQEEHLGVDDAHIYTELSEEETDAYKKKVTEMTSVLDKFISKKGPMVGLAVNLKNQLLGTSVESLTHVSRLPSPSDLESLLQTNELMMNFYIQKKNLGPIYSEHEYTKKEKRKKRRRHEDLEQDVVSPEEYLLSDYTGSYMGFDKLIGMYQRFTTEFEENGYTDQFMSGHFDDDEYETYQKQLRDASDVLHVTRKEGESLHDYLQRLVGEDEKQTKAKHDYIVSHQKHDVRSQLYFDELQDTARREGEYKDQKETENQETQTSIDNQQEQSFPVVQNNDSGLSYSQAFSQY